MGTGVRHRGEYFMDLLFDRDDLRSDHFPLDSSTPAHPTLPDPTGHQ